MKSGKNIFKLSRSQWIGVAVLASSLGLAVAVTLPFPTFTAGTPASASQVTDNFAALGTAVTAAEAAVTAANAQIATLNGKLPLVWAATDTTPLGTSLVAAGRTTLNSVSINAPSDGHLIISGNVFINNGGLAQLYTLTILIDGVDNASRQSVFAAAAGGSVNGALFNQSMTVTVPITAGAHTIALSVGPNGGTSDFFYNRNHLTALFLPSSQVTFTPLQVGLSTQPGSDPNGQ